MVRLKVTKNYQIAPVYRNFNSTMVRLKAPPVIPNFQDLSDFNSTMVRLKVFFKAAIILD